MFQYYNYIEIAALLTGIWLFSKTWNTAYKLLLVFVAITVVIELAGIYINMVLHQHNTWLYNLYVPLQGVLLLSIFSRIVQLAFIKKTINSLIAIFLVSVVISYYIQPDFLSLNNHALVISLVCFCIASSLFFIDVMRNNSTLPLTKQPGLWFATGVLMMSVLFICRFAFWNLVRLTPIYKQMLGLLINIADTFMYLGIIVTFICVKYSTKQEN